jgi:5-formyltetrahydrofolate cyclo-ligase
MKTKDEIRKEMWEIIEKNPAIFPEPVYGIPSFVGSDDAAERLSDLPEWIDAKSITIGFSPNLRAAREFAMKDDKIVYVAIPKLSEEKCYVELNSSFFKGREQYASSIKATYICGQEVGPWEMKKIDLCVTASVAVNEKGCKIGKGGGLGDLGYAICREHGIISDETTIVTIAHPLQVVSHDVQVERHDIPSDYILTPEKIIKTGGHYPKPQGVYWEDLREEYKTFPIMKRLEKRLGWLNTWESMFRFDQYVSNESSV